MAVGEMISGPFYHGTKADLRPGDLITPRHRSNYAHGKRTNAWVYLSAVLSPWAAELAHGDGPGRIYVVEPTGPFEDDPDLTDKRFAGNPTKSYRSRFPLRVIGEVLEWHGHSQEEIKTMKTALARHRAAQVARIAGIPGVEGLAHLHAQADSAAHSWAHDAAYDWCRLSMVIRGYDVAVFAAMAYRSAELGHTHIIECPGPHEWPGTLQEDDVALSGRVTEVTAWHEGWAAVIESCVTEIGLSLETRIRIAVDATNDTLTFRVDADGRERSWRRNLHLAKGVLTDVEQGEIWDFSRGRFDDDDEPAPTHALPGAPEMSRTIKIAAVQACPVYMDREATIAKACRLIAEVGAAGGELAVFPEAFVPGYPLWVWFIPAGHTHPLREVYAEFVANAVTVPSDATDQLRKAAKEAGVAVAIGINEVNAEGSGTTIYNTLLYIGPNGEILGKHRKVMPTGGERLVWALGDGSDLEVYDLPFGRVGGLLCWENYMPLARYAMSAWGTEIFVAPTWDRGEPWLSTMRHIAKEGRCFVVSCCTPMHKNDIPDRLAFKDKYLGAVEGWINTGDSVIVDPDGKIVAGPAREGETILYAELDRAMITGPRWQLDVAGHYARPDIFELIVHRRPKPLLTVSDDQDARD